MTNLRQQIALPIWHLHLHCFVPLERGECPECDKAIDHIILTIKAKVEKLDKYKEKNANNVAYTDHDGNKRIDKCKSYLMGELR